MSCRLMSFSLMSFMITVTTFLLLALSISAAPALVAPVGAALSPRTDHQGQGTYFFPGQGNCGQWNTNNDPIVAISTQIYNDGAHCDQWVQITNTANGQSTYAMVRDSCPSCAPGSLDMSPATFMEMSPLSTGVIQIKWHFMNRDFSGP